VVGTTHRRLVLIARACSKVRDPKSKVFLLLFLQKKKTLLSRDRKAKEVFITGDAAVATLV
jgi:hypothetical protein